jgi:hypothetical protein
MKIKAGSASLGAANSTSKGLLPRLWLLLALVFFGAGIHVQRQNLPGKLLFRMQMGNHRAIPSVWYAKDTGRAFMNWVITPFRPKPGALEFSVDAQEFDDLAKSMTQGGAGEAGQKGIPANLTFSGQNWEGTLFAGTGWHFEQHGSKYPLSVKIGEGETSGTLPAEFSLTPPWLGNSLWRWLMLEVAREEGLVVPPFQLQGVRINGKPMGVYSLEGRFSKVDELALEAVFERIKASGDGFDLNGLGKLLALMDLFGVQPEDGDTKIPTHPDSSSALPLLGSLDTGKLRKIMVYSGKPLGQLIKASPLLQVKYLETLERISTEDYVQSILGRHQKDLELYSHYLQVDEPGYFFPENILKENAKLIHASINPVLPLRIFLKEKEGARPFLWITNCQELPVEIISVSYRGNVSNLATPMVLEPNQGYPDYVSLDIPVDGVTPLELEEVEVLCRYRGCQGALPSMPQAKWISDPSLLTDPIRSEPNFDLFPDIFSFDREASTITICPGVHTINKTIIIPGNLHVIASDPVELDLHEGASLISYSPLAFHGSEKKPIKIHSSDQTGGGVAVLSARKESKLSGVIFENLSNPKSPGWFLTGAVTFYQSPVTIAGSIFRKNHCEDALNIVDTKFLLRGVTVEDTYADGFDGDFSNGRIEECTFTRTGNDSVDISGGVVSLYNCVVRQAGDKGISAGEGSSLEVEQIDVVGSYIGIAAKDRSSVDVRDSIFRDCKVTYAAYQKKPEFGPGSISAKGCQAREPSLTHKMEKGSKITVDGKELQYNVQDAVKDLYHGDS